MNGSTPPVTEHERQVQEALGFRLDDQGFATFVAGRNAWAVESLRAALGGGGHEFFYLCGPPGCGKTHLLTALHREFRARGGAACYLDLRSLRRLGPEPLYHAAAPLLAVDHADCIAGDWDFELALFALYNRWQAAAQGVLAVGARSAPGQAGFARPDLVTRLGSGVCCRMEALSEAECTQALQLKAGRRGLTLQQGVLDYLVSRSRYDMGSMTAMLELLDRASLREHHGITIPFVKRILGL